MLSPPKKILIRGCCLLSSINAYFRLIFTINTRIHMNWEFVLAALCPQPTVQNYVSHNDLVNWIHLHFNLLHRMNYSKWKWHAPTDNCGGCKIFTLLGFMLKYKDNYFIISNIHFYLKYYSVKYFFVFHSLIFSSRTLILSNNLIKNPLFSCEKQKSVLFFYYYSLKFKNYF